MHRAEKNKDRRPEREPVVPDPLTAAQQPPRETRRDRSAAGPPLLAGLADSQNHFAVTGGLKPGHPDDVGSIPVPVCDPVRLADARDAAVPFADSLEDESASVARYGPEPRWNVRLLTKLIVAAVLLVGLVGAMHELQIKRLRSAVQQKAQTAIEAGDRQTAIQSLQTYAGLGGDETSELLMLADLLGGRSDRGDAQQEAVAVLKRAVETDPDSVPVHRELVQAALDSGDYDTAVQTLESLQSRFPDDVDLRSFADRVRQLSRRSARRPAFAGGAAPASVGNPNFGRRPAPPRSPPGGAPGGTADPEPQSPAFDDWQPVPPAGPGQPDRATGPILAEDPVPGGHGPPAGGAGPGESPPTMVTPEPSAVMLMMTGLLAVGWAAWRRRRFVPTAS